MILLVRNPASGRDEAAGAGKVEEILRASDKLRVLEPSSAEAFPEEVRSAADGASRVVVAGGDGSMNLAINALRDRLGELRFGLIPTGTGNDLARTLGLPDDPARAAEVAAGRKRVHLDVWRAMNADVDRLFVNACMGGFSVQVDRSVTEDAKERFGPLAFWAGGIRAVADLQHHEVKVDGRVLGSCVAVGVGNGSTCGGGIRVWPEADPFDGLLDLCVLPVDDVLSGLRLLAKVKKGEHVDLPQVEYARSARIEIDADPKMEFNIDGELDGLRTPVRFEIFGDVEMYVT